MSVVMFSATLRITTYISVFISAFQIVKELVNNTHSVKNLV